MRTISDELIRLAQSKKSLRDKLGLSNDVPFKDFDVKIDTIGGDPNAWSSKKHQDVLNSIEPYVRPTGWLNIDDLVSEGQEKFVGLYKVLPFGTNLIDIECAGDYTVNWGDGTSTNHAANTQATKNLDYNSYVGTEGNLGFRQAIITVTPQNGHMLTKVNIDKKNVAWNNSRSDLSNRRYVSGWLEIKMSGVNIETLVCSGNNIFNTQFKYFNFVGSNKITSFNNTFRDSNGLTHVSINTSNGIDFTHMFSNCINLISVLLPDTSKGTNFSYMFFNCLKLKTIPMLDTSKGTNFSYMFAMDGSGQNSLEIIPLLNTSNGTNFSYMFSSCFIKNIPLLNTSNGTNFSYMFNSCIYLISIPLLNTSNGIDFTFMFYGCMSLVDIPLLNTSNGTSFSRMFDICNSLVSIPLLNTSNGTDFSRMFNGCISLVNIPLIDTSKGTNFGNMFGGCTLLRTIPLLDTSKGTNFSNMFDGCISLVNIPLLNTSNGTSFSSMFRNNRLVSIVPLIDTSKGTNFGSMFKDCVSIINIPALNLISATTTSGLGTYNTNLSLDGSMFAGCTNLSSSNVVNTITNISYVNCRLSESELNDVFTRLLTVSSRTIRINNNPGSVTCDKTIATSKGWTVLG